MRCSLHSARAFFEERGPFEETVTDIHPLREEIEKLEENGEERGTRATELAVGEDELEHRLIRGGR